MEAALAAERAAMEDGVQQVPKARGERASTTVFFTSVFLTSVFLTSVCLISVSSTGVSLTSYFENCPFDQRCLAGMVCFDQHQGLLAEIFFCQLARPRYLTGKNFFYQRKGLFSGVF